MRTKLVRKMLILGVLVAAGCGDDSPAVDAQGTADDASAGSSGEEPSAPADSGDDTDAGRAEEEPEDAGSPVLADGGQPEDSGLDAALDAAAEPDGGAALAVAITFEAKVGDAAFSCEASYASLGTTPGLSTRISDFRFYISELALIDGDGEATPVTLDQGGAFQVDDVALIDFENRKGSCASTGTTELNTTVFGRVPSGTYTGLRFSVGVPERYNHLDTAGRDTPSPLNIQAMAWNWASGRKFFRLDLASTSAPDGGAPVDAGKFVIHLGSTVCPSMGDPDAGVPGSCKNSNRPRIALSGFDAATHKVVVDVAAAVAASALDFNTPATATGCMSAGNDPECAPVFERFGLSLVSGEPDTGHTQSVFSVAAK